MPIEVVGRLEGLFLGLDVVQRLAVEDDAFEAPAR